MPESRGCYSVACLRVSTIIISVIHVIGNASCFVLLLLSFLFSSASAPSVPFFGQLLGLVWNFFAAHTIWRLVIVIIFLAIFAILLLLALVLLYGAIQEDANKCRPWLWFNLSIFILKHSLIFTYLFFALFSLKVVDVIFASVFWILTMFFEGFILWLVYRFIREIRYVYPRNWVPVGYTVYKA